MSCQWSLVNMGARNVILLLFKLFGLATRSRGVSKNILYERYSVILAVFLLLSPVFVLHYKFDKDESDATKISINMACIVHVGITSAVFLWREKSFHLKALEFASNLYRIPQHGKSRRALNTRYPICSLTIIVVEIVFVSLLVTYCIKVEQSYNIVFVILDGLHLMTISLATLKLYAVLMVIEEKCRQLNDSLLKLKSWGNTPRDWGDRDDFVVINVAESHEVLCDEYETTSRDYGASFFCLYTFIGVSALQGFTDIMDFVRNKQIPDGSYALSTEFHIFSFMLYAVRTFLHLLHVGINLYINQQFIDYCLLCTTILLS